MSELVRKAFTEMYPDRVPPEEIRLKYSRAFKGYNANVRFNRRVMEFRLSHDWKEVSDELKSGIVQSLLNKIYKTNIKTLNIEMYQLFLKKVSIAAPVTDINPALEESFDRINDRYFAGMLLKPNLIWGGKNLRTLGTYDYITDTIKISDILREDMLLLDYVMYHEMLHKKLRYREGSTRRMHHTTEFRKKERQFEDPDIEQKLKMFLARKRRKGFFDFF